MSTNGDLLYTDESLAATNSENFHGNKYQLID